MPTAISPIAAAGTQVAPTVPAAGPGTVPAFRLDDYLEATPPGGEPTGPTMPDVVGTIDELQAAHGASHQATLDALTGEADNVHEATLAATQAQVQLELVAAMRNRAIDGINEILRTQV